MKTKLSDTELEHTVKEYIADFKKRPSKVWNVNNIERFIIEEIGQARTITGHALIETRTITDLIGIVSKIKKGIRKK